jgi:hypothetical protein
VIFIGCKLFNIGRESNKTARRIDSTTGAGKKAPANPQALFDNASLITGRGRKRRLSGGPAGGPRLHRRAGRQGREEAKASGVGVVDLLLPTRSSARRT